MSVRCRVSDGKCTIENGSPEHLALTMCGGILNYDEEFQKFDLEKQGEIEKARQKLRGAGYVDGYKVTPKGEKALEFITECKVTG